MADTISSKKPHWWTSSHDLSWDKVKHAMVDEWNKVAAGAEKLEKSAAEHAISFGHGARDAYAKLGPWSAEVEAKLKADWEKGEHAAGKQWHQVRDAVKHGWDKTTTHSTTTVTTTTTTKH